MRRAALSIALLGACGDDDPVDGRADVVGIAQIEYVWFGVATISGAEDILGLELAPPQIDLHGYVTIVEHDPVAGRLGYTLVDECTPSLWAIDDPHVLAHELGHALGLEHVADESNLMFDHPPNGDALTDEQVDTIRERAWNLIHDCR